jgi:hypothetical protein
VGFSANQGSLCGYTQEKCPNCKRNLLAFSSRCTKEVDATREAQERRRREPAGRTMKTAGPTSGANRTALSRQMRAPAEGERGESEEQMVDVEEVGTEAEAITTVECTTPPTISTPAPSTKGTLAGMGAAIKLKN